MLAASGALLAAMVRTADPATRAHHGFGRSDPWPTLLWATGRAELPGHPRLTSWRWDSTVRD